MGNFQPTFREPSAHIQGTFGPHSPNLRPIFLEPSAHIQGAICSPLVQELEKAARRMEDRKKRERASYARMFE
jgi:hypothetical protein